MAALGLAALALGLASPRFWPWRSRDAPTPVVKPAAAPNFEVSASEMPNFEVSAAEMPTALPSGCWRSLGVQDDGSGVIYIQASKWRPWEYGTPEYVRLATYFLERMPEDGFVVLFDLDKYGARHALQLRKLTALITLLQSERYAGQLRACLFARAPGVFASSWSALKPIVSGATADAVRFVPTSSAEETAALLEHIDAALLPTRYGGTVDEASIPCPNLPGEADIL